ncbi:hypothetical protein [Planktothrix agardhii]|uniref:hypothetical protein n=1 Tax=Planktothrix agardhii TaxID=1160 RepID=UPI0003FB0AFD|nr:hypothetical protein [Planktothrix agardhii]
MNNEGQSSSFFHKLTVFLSSDNFFSEILKVSGILYFFGFIITRSHLLNYGITEIDLLQTKYISVGLFFIINVAIVWLPFIIQIINEIEEKQNKKITQSPYILMSYLILFICTIIFVFDIIKEPKYIFIISTLFFGLLSLIEIIIFNSTTIEFIELKEKPIIVLNKIITSNKKMIILVKLIIFIIQIIMSILVAHVFLYLSSTWIKTIDVNIFNLPDVFWNTKLKHILQSHINDYYSSLGYLILTWYLSLLIIGGSLYLLISNKVNTDTKTVLFVQARYWLIAIIIILSLFNIQKYSYDIYPVIPANLGGGSPTIVELILSEKYNLGKDNVNDKKYLTNFFLNENKNISNPVCLIAQTNDYYYISPCHNIIKKYEDSYKKPKNLLYKRLWLLKQDKNFEKTIQIEKKDILTIIYKKV